MKYKIIILKLIKPLPLISVLLFVGFMLIYPDQCKAAAIKGILLCGNVIIPTLFPFTFCVLFIMNSGVSCRLGKAEKATIFLFGQTAAEFTAMLMSFIGGYPTGAKLLSSMCEKKESTAHRTGLMLCYCVNAGPAFLVLAVGSGILHSKELGYILLAAHIIPSVITALLFKPFMNKKKIKAEAEAESQNLLVSDNIVKSAADSASAVLSICGYVILFSGLSAFCEYLCVFIPFLKQAALLLEVTSAVATTKNIYTIAFLTGFGGLCVWCQVRGMAKGVKLNAVLFVFSRIFHGMLSCGITYLLLKIFKVTVPTVSNGVVFSYNLSYSGLSLTLSLIGMSILFVISTFRQKTI